ncbi:NAD-binding Rossmann fold oxidoreductase family protein [Aspergillus fischeri NRRL 181]|uniref:NAD-binding Rossmann fold oxidoreductase family protein n=1 Tax=Neosartorya fischeri (strain ATCC 1020 / DSM 3700 / CBS 544.65 / FGSC A1164 / JCM 1740 / NRRL 181 / WB 181) TaxID=331117 RepID=A1DJZ0_NEOFI|nr:NAD-binding Rossmann fold oxidoreductase family protein [Aspergillus fischeri NRRL 181]EAW17029.1 NAD-binding Rossmann fold oxidoreductase family protein [Aspergillus fischeri NRRL 181]KAG2019198.1 hypothetical protein GB937_005492 [Aspergillus fischeri]
MSSKLNIGVVGIGRMGQRHALNLLHRVPRARLLCVCSPAPHEIEWAEQQLKPEGVQVFTDFQDMIRTPNLQAVVIASPTNLHIMHTLAAMERGIHVLCEKPITTDITELQSVIETTKKTLAARLMVAFVRRFDKNYADARRKIEAGVIGRPLIIRSQGTEKLDKSGYFINYARVSGGIFVDTVIHDIDLTLSFFGDEVIPKSCYGTGLISHHHEMTEFNDVDNAVGVVEFWDGRIAYYYHSRTTLHGYDNCTEIVGTDGKIGINLIPTMNKVQVSGPNGIVSEALPSWMDQYEEAFVTELDVFVEAILDGKEFPLKIEAALTGLRIAQALQESLVSGKKIEFNESGERK